MNCSSLPRRFRLVRLSDATGVSGTGYVAEGIQFSDGRCAMRWTTNGTPRSTAVYDSMEDLLFIHGHQGSTIPEWLD